MSIISRYPHVDILCGPGELDKLPAMVHNAVLTQSPIENRKSQIENSDRSL